MVTGEAMRDPGPAGEGDGGFRTRLSDAPRPARAPRAACATRPTRILSNNREGET